MARSVNARVGTRITEILAFALGGWAVMQVAPPPAAAQASTSSVSFNYAANTVQYSGSSRNIGAFTFPTTAATTNATGFFEGVTGISLFNDVGTSDTIVHNGTGANTPLPFTSFQFTGGANCYLCGQTFSYLTNTLPPGPPSGLPPTGTAAKVENGGANYNANGVCEGNPNGTCSVSLVSNPYIFYYYLPNNPSPGAICGPAKPPGQQDQCNGQYSGQSFALTFDAAATVARGSANGDGFGNISFVSINGTSQVPGPLPILGATTAFAFSRKLRRRITASNSSL
jgi:hypothetical protein